MVSLTAPKRDKPEMIAVQSRLAPDRYKAFAHVCFDEGLSMAEVIRQLIDELLKERESGK